MTIPTFIHLCWICGLRVDGATCKIDERGQAVHEACYVKRIAFENGARKVPVLSKTADHTMREFIKHQLP